MTTRTTIIVLHRPYILQTVNKMNLPEEASWQAQSRQKAKRAASNINVVLERLIDMDMIKFLKPMRWAHKHPPSITEAKCTQRHGINTSYADAPT